MIFKKNVERVLFNCNVRLMASFEATSTSTTQTQYIANGVLLHITAASVLDVQRSRTRTNFCLSSHLISHCRKVFKSNHMCSFLKKEEGEEVKRFLCYNLNWGAPDFSTAPFCTASEYYSVRMESLIHYAMFTSNS